jgi:hypothetical protein
VDAPGLLLVEHDLPGIGCLAADLLDQAALALNQLLYCFELAGDRSALVPVLQSVNVRSV